ncbi:DUF1178 family protein [Ramlibacter tataouinensis]|uniref:DUF1178 family protein n=1 Tax=Ramlibacter tataouinensis TaxID=94132 RepID=UPI0022F3FB81|nr:DUF1178 family protein [Ramlibacter tataouinensis]WBY01482.1 DUF1178 family protein [Ramlibacter tataouinensis]
MKVLNLQCSHRHAFEGWFGSEDDFQGQLERGLVECPMCGDTAVAKMPSAPRLNLGAQPDASPRQEAAAVPEAEMQKAWLKMVRHVMSHTEDVGERFAEEARRIHYGESEERGIRGQASREETQALLEEGIGVLPLPIPKALKGPVQ